MTGPHLDHVSLMRLDRDGTMSIGMNDGRIVTAQLGQQPFAPTSAVLSTTYFPALSRLHLRTRQGDDIEVDLPQLDDLAPTRGRPVIYLDQNHWSTLTAAMHDPDRIPNNYELRAASTLIEYAIARKILLPMSSAHISETCKQENVEKRYRRALTVARLSAGWQLRDPLHLRQLELTAALASRYRQERPPFPAAITLAPNGIHSGREDDLPSVEDSDLPPYAQWSLHVVRCATGLIDCMLDAEHIPMPLSPGWAADFQRFATFLRDNPTDQGLKRRRTQAKFIADLGNELPAAACRAGVIPKQMSDWTLNHSEHDLRDMPALGLFREVVHEKLSDSRLRWRDNDLVDMMYLTTAAGYCDYVVAERAHASHIKNSLRRLGRKSLIYTNIRSLMSDL